MLLHVNYMKEVDEVVVPGSWNHCGGSGQIKPGKVNSSFPTIFQF